MYGIGMIENIRSVERA